MPQALAPIRNSALRDHPKLAATLAEYRYEILWNDGDATLTVSDAAETMHVPLQWAFGRGEAGQTFLFQRDGRWYESRVSYFSAPGGLDLTVGMQDITPHTLLEAADRAMGPAESARCFDCHATNAAKPASLIEGVQCERCHGSADAHLKGATMRKLGALTTESDVRFLRPVPSHVVADCCRRTARNSQRTLPALSAGVEQMLRR